VKSNSTQLQEQLLQLEPDIKRMAAYFTGSYSLSDDIFQDVFLEFSRNQNGYREKSSFSTYVFGITRNVAYRHLKNAKKHSEYQHRQKTDNTKAYEEVSIIDRLSLNRALSKLKAKYREPLLLKEMEGLSYPEIADVLSINLGTVNPS
jgi:RNA polymerase sigma-70 factor (ECF subfamily)